MHWIVQENVANERQWDELVYQLKRLDIDHSVHKLVPFSGELIPDASEGYHNVWAYGSLSLAKTAERLGWTPGVIKLGMFDHYMWNHSIGPWMLNNDAEFISFKEVTQNYWPKSGEYFVRPRDDSKFIKGSILTSKELIEWAEKICGEGDDSGMDVKPLDQLMIASCKDTIAMEARFWVVKNQVVTWSTYKVGNQYTQSRQLVDEEMITFARKAAGFTQIVPYNPKTYCMDIARLTTPKMIWVDPATFNPVYTDFVVIEYNNINSSGLYDADIQKMVQAIQIAYSK
jgi:hypothetical protein